MNMAIIMIVIILLLLSVAVFLNLKNRKGPSYKIEEVIVSYSEVIGNKLIEHDEQYIGKIDKEKDLFSILKLGINLPIPKIDTYIYTKSGKTKFYLVKIGQERYGYRIPTTNNQVFIQQRDEYGNLIKVNGKPKLKKFKWFFCDDVVEPEVKHWHKNMMEKLKEKHKTNAEILSKWIGPITVAIIMIAGIIVAQITWSGIQESADKQIKIAGEITHQNQQTGEAIENLINRIDPKEKSGG